jgi:hypothetical protein
MGKRRRRKTKAPQPNGNGDLVRAVVAARLLGFDARTVRGYVRRKVWSGRVVAGRVYVHRSVVEALRDRGSPDVSMG